jgi:hypothetical protein
MSDESEAVPGIEIDEDIRIERWFWVAERIGWGAMALFILSALAGLFGRGPLSFATVSDPVGALAVEYERFCRQGMTTDVEVRAGPAVPRDGRVEIAFSRRYLESFSVEVVTPEAHLVAGGDSSIRYVFLLEERGSHSATILFELRPRRMGRVEGEVAAPGVEPLRFSQVIYP